MLKFGTLLVPPVRALKRENDVLQSVANINQLMRVQAI